MKDNEQDVNYRMLYIDYLRVFATFAVIILHISAQNWYAVDVNRFEWKVFNFFDSIVRWCVPCFVMISGVLFLGREVSIKKIYTKYVLRLVIAFIVWSAVYAICQEGDVLINDRFIMLLQGRYHMWFIPMIIGLYMCVPFIKAIIENEKRGSYYLLLTFVFASLIPQIKTLIEDFGGEMFGQIIYIINENINDMNMHIVMGYAGYFVLGYYLNKITLDKRWRIVIYLLGIAGFAATIFLSMIVALRTQSYCDHYYGYFNINVLLESVAVFTWFRYSEFKWERWNAFVRKLSRYSFGAYLSHVLIIEQLKIRFGLHTMSTHAVLGILCIGVLVFVMAFVLSAILNQIPVIKKYIV